MVSSWLTQPVTSNTREAWEADSLPVLEAVHGFELMHRLTTAMEEKGNFIFQYGKRISRQMSVESYIAWDALTEDIWCNLPSGEMSLQETAERLRIMLGRIELKLGTPNITQQQVEEAILVFRKPNTLS